MIQYWLEVMKYLLDNYNFDTLHAIHLGLQQGIIQQLQTAWTLVDHPFKSFYRKMLELFEHQKNFKNYREQLEKCSPRVPCIPIQSLTLRDLTFAYENATFLKNGNINMKKLNLISKILRDYMKYKEVLFNIEEDVLVQHFISTRVVESEKVLYEKARDILIKEKKRTNLIKEQERKIQERTRKLTRMDKKLPSQFEKLLPPNPKYSVFYSWLMQNIGTDNIDFYNKVNDWEASNWPTEESRLKSAQLIYQEYKNLLIGVNSNLTKEVEIHLQENNTSNLFERLKLEVKGMLQIRYEEWLNLYGS